MYICPECGEKLNQNATICPCCGRGNREARNNKYDFILIIIGLIIFSIGTIVIVSSSYEKKEMIYYGENYSFTYKKGDWAKTEKVKPIDENSDILLFNNNDDIYIQFDKKMTDLGFDVDVDSSRSDLYNALYKELITYSRGEYSNLSSTFNKVDEKYYLNLNYQYKDTKAKMYILCYKTKVMVFYIIHNGKNFQKVEDKLLDIFKNIKIN